MNILSYPICDSSSYGVGTVLFHKWPNGMERPVMLICIPFLNNTEKKYFELDKEALALCLL